MLRRPIETTRVTGHLVFATNLPVRHAEYRCIFWERLCQVRMHPKYNKRGPVPRGNPVHLTKRLSHSDERASLPKATEQSRVDHLCETANQPTPLKIGSRTNLNSIPTAAADSGFLALESWKNSAGRYVAR